MTPVVCGWLRDQALRVKEEFNLPWGIPDVVGASFNAERVEKRLSLGQREAIGPFSRINILLEVPHIEAGLSVSLRELWVRLGGLFSEEEIAAELGVLAKRHFVRRDEKGCFQSVNGWMPLHERLVVVELKLDRIDDALSQARKNKGLSWESYVGLPLTVAERVMGGKKAGEFREAGVGLLGVSAWGVQELLPARDLGVSSRAVETHCLERFWRDGLQAVKH